MFVFAAYGGEVQMTDLSGSECYHFPELRMAPKYLKSKTAVLVRKMADIVCSSGKYEETTIESMTTYQALWGELLAKELGGRHLCFLLNETFRPLSSGERSFLLAKSLRGELRVISKGAWDNLFRKRKIPDYCEDKRVVAYLLSTTGCYEKKFRRDCVVIGTIGRLNKPYVSNMIKSVVQFSKDHTELNVVFDVIGSSEAGDVESRLMRLGEENENLKVILRGSVFPIDIAMLDEWDAAIASAGSALIPADLGIPTIDIDMHSLEPHGILGYEIGFDSTWRSESVMSGKTILDHLNEIIIQGNCGGPPLYSAPRKDESCFGEHLNYLKTCSQTKQYYDTSKICPNRYEKLISLLVRLTGNPEWVRALYTRHFNGLGHGFNKNRLHDFS